MRIKQLSFVLAALGWLTLSQVRADDPPPAPPVTTISVPTIHCEGCAKKITAALKKVDGVESVAADVKAKTLTVTPKKDMEVSAKALWEAVEKAGYKVSKVKGPSGEFTKKPKA